MISQFPIPFIFIHIPKTAGTSVELGLLPHVANVKHWNCLPRSKQRELYIPDSGRQHLVLAHFAEHYDLDDFFVWSIVRNPYDRAISQCLYLSSKSHLFERAEPGNSDVWERNIRNLCNYDGWLASQNLSATQSEHLGIQNKLKVDRVVKFESLQDDWPLICDRIGIPSTPLPFSMSSKGRSHYLAYYNKNMRECIQQRFLDDFHNFDYGFGD